MINPNDFASPSSGGGYGSYAHGSADRPHAASDTGGWDPWSVEQSGIDYTTIPDASFFTLIQMALAQSGVDPSRLSISQIYQLAVTAWNDPLIQQDYQLFAASSPGTYQSVTDFTATQAGLFAAVKDQIFTPGKSSNPQLLAMGLGFLQNQNVPLNSAQASFIQSTGAQVPKIFQGNFPVTESHDEGDPGVDYGTPVGTQISTPFSGTVELDRSGKSNWGNRVLIKLDNGYTFAVGHLTAFSVQQGQRVNPGDIIGYSGGAVNDPNSGITTGPHIEVQWIDPNGNFLDPTQLVDSIQSGTTFGAIGESGAIGQGVTTPKFPGDDALLDTQYPGVVSIWQKYFGSPPTGQQILGVVGQTAGQAGQAVSAGQTSVEALAQQVGFSAQEAQIVAAISMAESGGDPSRDQYPGQNYGGIGLMQIEYEAHPDLLAKYGGVQGLHDPLNNLKAAYDVFVAAGRSFSPWTTFTGGNYLQFMGQNPTISTGGGTAGGAGVQLDQQQIENTIRGYASHIPGMNMGQYTDLKSATDAVSQKAVGHASTDGIIAELFRNKQTGAGDIQDWYDTHSPNEINSADYANIVTANQPYLQNVYNEQGFDPRWAQQQYTQAQMQQPGASGGGTGTPPTFQQPSPPPSDSAPNEPTFGYTQ